MKAKIKTGLVVLVLSILIWVFAENQVVQEDTLEVKISLKNSREDLEVDFLDEEAKVLEKEFVYVRLTVAGSGGRIKAMKARQSEIDIPLEITKLIAEPAVASKDYEIPVVNKLLEQKLNHENIYLKVIQSEPEAIRVRVTKLVPQNLLVKVIDAYGSKELTTEVLDPSSVTGFVRAGQKTPDVLVSLSDEQRARAVKEEVSLIGRVVLPGGPKEVPVRLKLKEAGGSRALQRIPLPQYRFLIPPSMLGQYIPRIENEQLLKEPIQYRGSLAAEEMFRSKKYHLILEIREEDVNQPKVLRPIRYDIPKEYINDLEIVNPLPQPIEFHLEKNVEKTE